MRWFETSFSLLFQPRLSNTTPTHTTHTRSGDIASLQVEAVVNPTNEGLTDKNPITVRLFEMAGPELREECKTQIGSTSLDLLREFITQVSTK